MLIIYPHGLGDIILLTPALEANPHPVNVAILRRLMATEILDHCPKVRAVHAISDPWNDYPTKAGVFWSGPRREGQHIAKHLGMPSLFIRHPPRQNKIHLNAARLVLRLREEQWHTRVYISEQHKEQAEAWLYRHEITTPFGFVHGSTGMPGLSTARTIKDLPDGWGQRWIRERFDLPSVVVHESFNAMDLPVPTQFEIMRRAERRVLADSVFFHAACAMDLPIDLAFFGRGPTVYDEVKPHHDVRIDRLILARSDLP